MSGLVESSADARSKTIGQNFRVRASVYFNGQGTAPTSFINGSQNVTSVTENYSNDYTVNFTSALPNANYSASVSVGMINNGDGPVNTYVMCNRNRSSGNHVSPTTTAFRFNTYSSTTTQQQYTDVYVIITG